MDFREAQSIINEVLQVLEDSALEKYSLVEAKASEANEASGIGYTVVIKAFLGSVRKQQVYQIAEKHGLTVQEEQDGLTLSKR